LNGIFSVLIFPSFFCFAFLLRQKEKRADQTRSNAIKRDQTRFSISTSYEIFSSVLQKKESIHCRNSSFKLSRLPLATFATATANVTLFSLTV